MDSFDELSFLDSPLFADDQSAFEFAGQALWSYNMSPVDSILGAERVQGGDTLLPAGLPNSNGEAVVASMTFAAIESPKRESYRRTRKSWKSESKASAPDEHDHCDFEHHSPAYLRLRLLGFSQISLQKILHIGGLIEDLAQTRGVTITQRNRAARRRKPNAFHWLDENFHAIRPSVYDQAVLAVLGNASGPRRQ
jgi:hypothetical protein